jgi:hypothetical protein
MPTSSGGSFRLRLRIINFSPNTMWKKQCWGCGGPGVTEELTFVTEWTSEEPNKESPFGEYCNKQCIGKAVPELARCSLDWKVRNQNTGLFLGKDSDESFWDLLNVNELEQMEGAGWANQRWGAWILQPEEDSEDDSSIE